MPCTAMAAAAASPRSVASSEGKRRRSLKVVGSNKKPKDRQSNDDSGAPASPQMLRAAPSTAFDLTCMRAARTDHDLVDDESAFHLCYRGPANRPCQVWFSKAHEEDATIFQCFRHKAVALGDDEELDFDEVDDECTPAWIVRVPGLVQCAAVSDHHMAVASGSMLYMFLLAEGRRLGVPIVLSDIAEKLELTWSSNGYLVALLRNGQLLVWDVERGTVAHAAIPGTIDVASIHSLDVSPSRQEPILILRDGRIFTCIQSLQQWTQTEAKA
mmetsp:Transcript_3180/g.5854  ORF Transcript_3180/g.5854 Transcript_3180/m.5854 type:complete len:271 (+) Transcript_3180:3-815(+)